MSGFITSALEILKDEKKLLHSKEITKLALEKGILETDGKTPDQTMNSLLLTDIKKRGESSNFIQTGPSTFGLNPNKPDIEVIDNSEIEEEEEKIQIESGYTGKGGEHIVCSKLLFRGFNASIMSVDVGLDIVAIKDKEVFGIQVKTSNLNKFNTYLFDIRKASFERHSSNNIFYIFHYTFKFHYKISTSFPKHNLKNWQLV